MRRRKLLTPMWMIQRREVRAEDADQRAAAQLEVLMGFETMAPMRHEYGEFVSQPGRCAHCQKSRQVHDAIQDTLGA